MHWRGYQDYQTDNLEHATQSKVHGYFGYRLKSSPYKDLLPDLLLSPINIAVRCQVVSETMRVQEHEIFMRHMPSEHACSLERLHCYSTDMWV